jgi:hypothetical protein
MEQMGLMMICCGMAVRRMGMPRVRVRKIKALSVKMETVNMIGEGRCIRCVKLIVIYFSQQTFYFCGVILDLDNYVFPWQMCFV